MPPPAAPGLDSAPPATPTVPAPPDAGAAAPPLPMLAAASVLLLRDGAEGLEVFMVQRHARSSVLGGVYVFPGGKVDPQDGAEDWRARVDLPPEALQARLGQPGLDAREALALHVAAARESFEECGVVHAQGRAAAPARPDEPFADWVARAGLRLELAALRPFSRWITPENSVTIVGKRFDTRFFLAPLPDGQQAVHDNHEAVHSDWLTPREALRRYWAGQISLAPPQIMSLSHLMRWPDRASALAAAEVRPPYLVQPRVCPQPDGASTVMAYPGDPLHPEPARVMPGPLRLLVRAPGRFEPDGGFEAF